jgi:hypothetical protein
MTLENALYFVAGMFAMAAVLVLALVVISRVNAIDLKSEREAWGDNPDKDQVK